jgi:hypothetical protein
VKQDLEIWNHLGVVVNWLLGACKMHLRKCQLVYRGSCILFCILTPNYDFGVADDYLAPLALLFSLPRIHLRILGSLELQELSSIGFHLAITDLYNPREYPHLLYLDLQSIRSFILTFILFVQPTGSC